eukprot:7885531-Ditylum_brightwellii.AAC.1
MLNASGNIIKGNMVGDMSSVVCDKNDQEICHVIFKGILHLPQTGYNLFSIIKQLEEDWALGRDTDTIWFTK